MSVEDQIVKDVRTAKIGEPWTLQDDMCLLDEFYGGTSLTDLAQGFLRPHTAIMARLVHLHVFRYSVEDRGWFLRDNMETRQRLTEQVQFANRFIEYSRIARLDGKVRKERHDRYGR